MELTPMLVRDSVGIPNLASVWGEAGEGVRDGLHDLSRSLLTLHFYDSIQFYDTQKNFEGKSEILTNLELFSLRGKAGLCFLKFVEKTPYFRF